MTFIQRKAFDAFTASAKAWFTMEAERLGWHWMANITCVCKTYMATFCEDIEDTVTCVDNRLTIEIGVFMDCERSPVNKCTGCDEVSSIYYSIGSDAGSADLLKDWCTLLNEDAAPYMPDFFKWEGDNIDPDIEDEEEEEEDTDNHYDPWDDPDGNYDFANPGGTSALRRATDSNPRNLPCSQCGRENVLTPKDKSLGYVCDICADRNELGGP
jgi:hypothetical protein